MWSHASEITTVMLVGFLSILSFKHPALLVTPVLENLWKDSCRRGLFRRVLAGWVAGWQKGLAASGWVGRLAEGWGRRGVGATRAAVPPQVTWQGWVLWPTSNCNTDPSSHFTLLPSSSFSSTLKLFTYPCHLFYHLRWGLASIR